ncbi:DUF2267 domain-containing protein [Sagittula salina]|uniref:DUF2267 domain-containing protein n=1 Tax=Sagittula salina TaxID=2820268 RepID=A0A940S2F8_9RHOB|nr:DUF2267 domain-containing protein [Sagittula salina]MBP0481610.1 DUF2267 domain-containing protein [Sagittula salina]
MPMPWTFRHSQKDFSAFLADAADRMDLTTDNATYTAVEAVLHCFRARQSPQQVADFAQVRPPILRAILIEDWTIPDRPAPWADRDRFIAEVMSHRCAHNLTPDNAIEATAWALRRHLRQVDLDRVLERFGPAARAFWTPGEADPAQLAQRIL